MNAPFVLPAGFDPALKPTWRLLRNQVGAFCSAAANRRAERLVLRFMDRGWPEARLEQLLARVIERDDAPRCQRGRRRDVHA